MKSRNLLTTLFIVSIGLSSCNNELKIEPNCYYVLEKSPTYICWFLFNPSMTRFDYESPKSSAHYIGYGEYEFTMDENVIKCHTKEIDAYFKNNNMIVVETDKYPFVEGTYIKSKLYYRGEWTNE